MNIFFQKKLSNPNLYDGKKLSLHRISMISGLFGMETKIQEIIECFFLFFLISHGATENTEALSRSVYQSARRSHVLQRGHGDSMGRENHPENLLH